jgi:hypothetical protein
MFLGFPERGNDARIRLTVSCRRDCGARIRRVGRYFAAESFAGLFAAAPSIALATLLITLSQKGAPFAAVEGSTMIVGALGLAAYSYVVCVLLKKFLMSVWSATVAALLVWFVVSFGITAALSQPS